MTVLTLWPSWKSERRSNLNETRSVHSLQCNTLSHLFCRCTKWPPFPNYNDGRQAPEGVMVQKTLSQRKHPSSLYIFPVWFIKTSIVLFLRRLYSTKEFMIYLKQCSPEKKLIPKQKYSVLWIHYTFISVCIYHKNCHARTKNFMS